MCSSIVTTIMCLGSPIRTETWDCKLNVQTAMFSNVVWMMGVVLRLVGKNWAVFMR